MALGYIYALQSLVLQIRFITFAVKQPMGDMFEEYLAGKKISAYDFKKASPDEYQKWEELYGQVHPTSFNAQKLYLINAIRRLYPLPKSSLD